MFRLLKNIFGPDHPAENPEKIEAPSTLIREEQLAPQSVLHQQTGVSYKPALVNQLQEDHQKLLVLFGEIQGAAAKGQFKLLRNKMTDFKNMLNSHLLVENMHFYAYVSSLYAEDEENATTIHEFRREMGGISRVVKDFLKKYENIDNLAELPAFQTNLTAIGEALVKRVQREEKDLYSLYLPR